MTKKRYIQKGVVVNCARFFAAITNRENAWAKNGATTCCCKCMHHENERHLCRQTAKILTWVTLDYHKQHGYNGDLKTVEKCFVRWRLVSFDSGLRIIFKFDLYKKRPDAFVWFKCKVDILSNFCNMYLKHVEHNLNPHNFRLYFWISIMFWDILRCGSQILPTYQRNYSDRLD